MFMDLKCQLEGTNVNQGRISSMLLRAQEASEQVDNALDKARMIEDKIRRIEPSFETRIDNLRFLRVSKIR